MGTFADDEATRIVEVVKALLGPPALFSTQKEADYYKIMYGLAKSFAPQDAFGFIQLSDMTFAEMRKNWLTDQQTQLINQVVRQHKAAQTQRKRVQSQKQENKASEAAAAADLSQETPAFRRQLSLEENIDSAPDDVDALMDNAVQEVAATNAIKASMGFYGVLDGFKSTEIDRRNECAEWNAWYRDVSLTIIADTNERGCVHIIESMQSSNEPSLVPGEQPPQ
jgi:hypothetical protein